MTVLIVRNSLCELVDANAGAAYGTFEAFRYKV